MPGMDGLEVTRILGRDLPESKVVIVARNEPAVGRRQPRNGAATYVAKCDLALQLLPTLDAE